MRDSSLQNDSLFNIANGMTAQERVNVVFDGYNDDPTTKEWYPQ